MTIVLGILAAAILFTTRIALFLYPSVAARGAHIRVVYNSTLAISLAIVLAIGVALIFFGNPILSGSVIGLTIYMFFSSIGVLVNGSASSEGRQ